MAYVDLITGYQKVENGHWVAQWGQGMDGHEGAQLALRLPISDETGYSPRYLLLDGVSVSWLDANATVGRTIRLNVNYYDALSHDIDQMVTTASSIYWQAKTITLDGLRLDLVDQYGFFMYAGFSAAGEAGDYLRVAAWGRYEQPPTIPSLPTPTPVSLEGYKWPLKRR